MELYDGDRNDLRAAAIDPVRLFPWLYGGGSDYGRCKGVGGFATSAVPHNDCRQTSSHSTAAGIAECSLIAGSRAGLRCRYRPDPVLGHVAADLTQRKVAGVDRASHSRRAYTPHHRSVLDGRQSNWLRNGRPRREGREGEGDRTTPSPMPNAGAACQREAQPEQEPTRQHDNHRAEAVGEHAPSEGADAHRQKDDGHGARMPVRAGRSCLT